MSAINVILTHIKHSSTGWSFRVATSDLNIRAAVEVYYSAITVALTNYGAEVPGRLAAAIDTVSGSVTLAGCQEPPLPPADLTSTKDESAVESPLPAA